MVNGKGSTHSGSGTSRAPGGNRSWGAAVDAARVGAPAAGRRAGGEIVPAVIVSFVDPVASCGELAGDEQPIIAATPHTTIAHEARLGLLCMVSSILSRRPATLPALAHPLCRLSHRRTARQVRAMTWRGRG
jgi:hypothetical protein